MTTIRVEEVEALARRLEGLEMREPLKHPIWSKPPGPKCLDCVMSLNRNYKVIEARVLEFCRKNPNVQSVSDLKEFMDSFSSPAVFLREEFKWSHDNRATALSEVVKWQSGIADHYEWAASAQVQDYKILNIKHFKIAGFQYLRMLFGADTVKPDIYIKKFISEVIGYEPDELRAVLLFEEACRVAGVKAREADTVIWDAYRDRNPKSSRDRCGAH